jgi:hypothetical protein
MEIGIPTNDFHFGFILSARGIQWKSGFQITGFQTQQRPSLRASIKDLKDEK